MMMMMMMMAMAEILLLVPLKAEKSEFHGSFVKYDSKYIYCNIFVIFTIYNDV